MMGSGRGPPRLAELRIDGGRGATIGCGWAERSGTGCSGHTAPDAREQHGQQQPA